MVLLACPGVKVFAANRAIGARDDVATLTRVFFLWFFRDAADKLASGGP